LPLLLTSARRAPLSPWEESAVLVLLLPWEGGAAWSYAGSEKPVKGKIRGGRTMPFQSICPCGTRAYPRVSSLSAVDSMTVMRTV